MTGAAAGGRTAFIERLAGGRPIVAVELRPPRSGLSSAEGLEAWIDANHSLRRLSGMETAVFLTDNAVGRSEEENLQHLLANVGQDLDTSRIVPFLTCKHSLDYCTWYAQRAAQSGYRALIVLGGDPHDGLPRCVAHACELRRLIRERHPEVALGGWANPRRDPAQQVGFLQDPAFTADFFLTQVVSHLDMAPVDSFLERAAREGLALPGIFGVFYYRSDNPRTLRRLARFLPVPAEALAAEFAGGVTPDELCARTIRALRARGITRVYVSNLPTADSHRILGRLMRMLGDAGP